MSVAKKAKIQANRPAKGCQDEEVKIGVTSRHDGKDEDLVKELQGREAVTTKTLRKLRNSAKGAIGQKPLSSFRHYGAVEKIKFRGRQNEYCGHFDAVATPSFTNSLLDFQGAAAGARISLRADFAADAPSLALAKSHLD